LACAQNELVPPDGHKAHRLLFDAMNATATVLDHIWMESESGCESNYVT